MLLWCFYPKHCLDVNPLLSNYHVIVFKAAFVYSPPTVCQAKDWFSFLRSSFIIYIFNSSTLRNIMWYHHYQNLLLEIIEKLFCVFFLRWILSNHIYKQNSYLPRWLYSWMCPNSREVKDISVNVDRKGNSGAIQPNAAHQANIWQIKKSDWTKFCRFQPLLNKMHG